MTIVFEGCSVFDGVSAELRENATVVVENGRIVEVADGGLGVPADAERVACGGRTLMPGLIDAHFHALLVDLNIASIDDMPASLLHQHARHNLESALRRGFTTVRDAGGADLGLALAVERGLIAGPRILFAGRGLSQTGGHGDMRNQTRFEPCGCAGYHGPLTQVADGVDAVRQVTREELRKGAHQIKMMVSGGVLSPTDPIWMDQYSDEEIRVGVEEAATRRTYVMAHAHTASAVRRCAALGVRSIEHGTLIDAEAAEAAAAAGAFVVPTLVTLFAMIEAGDQFGLPKIFAEKLQGLGEDGLRSLEICQAAGVPMGFGTDLVGPLHDRQSQEFLIRGQVLASVDVLRSATSTNAALIQRSGELGAIAPGAVADILVVDGDPLSDLGLLQEQGRHIPVIMKDGRFHKNEL
ncbi:MAG: amidohydrolase family protein [Rhodospirillales bacterium]|nr:amidohydrolase family protein [Rhodospirillales bacterium]